MTPEELAREPNLTALQHARSVRETDPALALTQFRALAGLGSPMAMTDIGYMYGEGIGVQANPSEEEVWYKRAVEAGSVFGQFALAHLYLRTQRYSEAFAACETAAASGYAPAMYFYRFHVRTRRGHRAQLEQGAGSVAAGGAVGTLVGPCETWPCACAGQMGSVATTTGALYDFQRSNLRDVCGIAKPTR